MTYNTNFWKSKVIFISINISLFLLFPLNQCSESDSKKDNDENGSDTYLASNLPNKFNVDIPDSISNVQGTLESAFKKMTRVIPEDQINYNSGLGQIKEAVAKSKRTLIDEWIEYDYMVADAFYPKIVKNLNENNTVPEDTIFIIFTKAMKNRLIETYMQYLSESDAVEEVNSLMAEEDFEVGDEIWNPNFQLETLSEGLYDQELRYWWSDDVLWQTRISWSNDKTRVQVAYESNYENDIWHFTYSYDDNIKTVNIRDIGYGYNTDYGNYDYSELFSLQECGTENTCVNIQLMDTYLEELGSWCDGEDGKISIIGKADDNGGFLHEEGVYKCSTSPPEKEIFREEFNEYGEILNYWEFYDDGGVGYWIDADGNEYVSFSTDSNYFDPTNFEEGGFSLGQVEVIVNGLPTVSITDYDFVFVPKGILPDDPRFEELILGWGYYYYEVDGSDIYTELETEYWGLEEMVIDPGLNVYQETINAGVFEYNLLSGLSVSLAE
jgi:hypothetical protein